MIAENILSAVASMTITLFIFFLCINRDKDGDA